MELTVLGEKFIISEKAIVGKCITCNLPLLDLGIADFTPLDTEKKFLILWKLCNVITDEHEICIGNPRVFLNFSLQKSIKF